MTISPKKAESLRVEIGGIARAHGIRGEVVIVTHDPQSQTLATVKSIFIDDKPYEIESVRDTQRGWLTVLQGLSSRTEAEQFAGRTVSVAREDLGLGEGDVLLDDMIGCKTVLPDGSSWGLIVEIDLGFQDRLIIVEKRVNSDGAACYIERMLPIVDQFVLDVDIASGIVKIDPPDGMPEHVLDKAPVGFDFVKQ
jgi:16S rRNA processing protein RimM